MKFRTCKIALIRIGVIAHNLSEKITAKVVGKIISVVPVCGYITFGGAYCWADG
jgi:hypothetical protein